MKKTPEKLYLIDGMASIFRFYFALPDMTNQSGFPTNAIYGFHGMLTKLIEEEKPDYLGVAFDLPGPTIRHQEYSAYKANRPPPPAELVDQIPKIRDLCSARRIPILQHEGFEADDILGTLARKAAAHEIDVYLVTSDKDLLQMVDRRVRILHTGKNRVLDLAGVEEFFGVRPDQVVDVLALWGDSADNIKGIPGIGEKGAKDLIKRFGNLEECFRRASEVTRKNYREGLQKYRQQAEQSRSLVTIRTDVPVDLDLDALRVTPPDAGELNRLFEELDFRREDFEDETGFPES